MVAKGFKGRYFSLQAITATVSYILISRKNISYKKRILQQLYFESEDESPPEIEEVSNIALTSDKPCYCNIFFACLAHKILKLSRIKKPPLCRCRKTKTGIAPPKN